MLVPKLALKAADDLRSSEFDGLVVVGSSVGDIAHDILKAPLKEVLDVDPSADLFVVPGKEVKRIVFSGTGPLNKDYDDVRRLNLFSS